MKALFLILSILPKNLISYCTGVLVRIKVPGPLGLLINRAFVKAFNIDMGEAEHPINYYKSIEEVFTRKLKPSARETDFDAFVSPSDSELTTNESIKGQSSSFVIKGINYNPEEMIGEAFASPAWISVFYLAPHDYHRVHSPFTGNLLWVKHIPGLLWPVKPSFLRFFPELFNKNERLIFKFHLKTGGSAYLVMVGAFNVGRMTSPFAPSLVTNNSHFMKESKHELSPCRQVTKGDELGTFMMGSTVITLLDEEALVGLGKAPNRGLNGSLIKVGKGLL